MNQIQWTDTVPVYTAQGEQIHMLKLPEKIMPIPAKRGGFSESGVYYKGSGTVYTNHLINQIKSENTGEKTIGKTRLIYEKYIACYPKLTGRFGIFLFPHQAIFSDYEGGCGKKEQKIIENQKLFERSAIDEIIGVIPTGIENHNIYAYRLKAVRGGLNDTQALIEYVLNNDFNTAWDKNLWSDIYAFGFVRDVADWFVSKQLNHKIGTVFALLHSLYQSDVSLYAQLLLNCLGTYSFEKYKILYYSALIVKKYCAGLFETEGVEPLVLNEEMYGKLLTLLFSGKACCHLEDDAKWNWVRAYYDGVREEYLQKIREQLDTSGSRSCL